MFSEKPSVYLKQLIVTTAIVLAGASLRLWPLDALGLKLVYITFYPAVMIAAVYGGMFAGLTATLLSSLIIYYWQPAGLPFIQDTADRLGMAVFLINGVLISFVGESLKQANLRLRRENESTFSEIKRAELASRQAEQAALAEYRSEQRFRAYFERSMVGMATTTAEKRWADVNPALCQMLGYSAEELKARTWAELTHPDDLALNVDYFDQLNRGEIDEYEMDKRFIKRNGEIVYTHIAARGVRKADKSIDYLVVLIEDVTKRTLAEQTLHDQESQFRIAVETSTDGFMAINPEGKIVEVNDAYIKRSGYSRAELLRMGIPDLESKENVLEVSRHIEKVMQEGRDQFESLHRTKDGKIWPVEVSVTYSALSGGRFFIFYKDITERKKTEQQIWHQANFDRLTELPNRALFFDRLSKELSQAKRAHAFVGLLFLDLDGFKPVNDRYGHDAGDVALKTVSARWRLCLRDSDTLARLGGDEFAVIAGNLESPEMATSVAEKLIEAFARPIQLPNQIEVVVGVSIGVSIYPDNATEMDSLLSSADAAMYESKSKGKNTFSFSKSTPDKIVDSSNWIKFDDAHLVGIDVIDDQHRHLVLLLNQLNQALANPHTNEHIHQLFVEVINYTVDHFKTEFQLMQEANYPDIAAHEEVHERLLQEIRDVMQHFDQGNELLILQTLKDWLLNHIVQSDQPLADFLISKKNHR